MSDCAQCKKGKTLYKCPVCGATAHIDKPKKLLVIHLPPIKPPKAGIERKPPVSFCFPSHFDCELAKPINLIDLEKLEKVEAHT